MAGHRAWLAGVLLVLALAGPAGAQGGAKQEPGGNKTPSGWADEVKSAIGGGKSEAQPSGRPAASTRQEGANQPVRGDASGGPSGGGAPRR